MDTQELDNLIEEEEEFLDAVEHFEHDVGINQSMIDWHKVNFESSFGNSGEFSGRLASVVQPMKCDDCEINSETINKQRELMMKQDKQIQESHNIQRDFKEKLKRNILNLNDTVKELARSTKEAESLKEQLQIQKYKVLAMKMKYESDSGMSMVKKPEAQKQHKAEEEEGPLNDNMSQCKKCDFKTKNKVLMGEHQEKYHGGYKCLMCPEKFKNKKNLLQHMKMHEKELNNPILSSYPMNALSFKCTSCQESFRTSEDMMNHLSQKHLSEEQRRGDGLAKYQSSHEFRKHDEKKPICTNGDGCRFHRQNRCNFHHDLPPKVQKNQTPSSEWKQVPSRWQPYHQGYNVQKSQEHNSQGPWSWRAPRDTSTTRCKHPDNCLQGRFCVMRQYNEQDFPSWIVNNRN